MYHDEWKKEDIAPFSELMLSWNGPRPAQGTYHFYVSVKIEEWSPWLLYASWGKDSQSSYLTALPEMPVRVYQDAVEVLEGAKATGYQVKVVAEGDAPSMAIHVYTNGDQDPNPASVYTTSIYLPVEGISQMALNHVRHTDLCSPTSTTSVVRYLSGRSQIDPCQFAHSAWDEGFDIFGNWVLNVAQASVELGPNWNTWVERLSGFDDIYASLERGIPVVVSVRGPLPGSAAPYAKGHLIAVIGYDVEAQKVICMDPAFQVNSQTHVYYDLGDFIQAWNRRGRIAYCFASSGSFFSSPLKS